MISRTLEAAFSTLQGSTEPAESAFNREELLETVGQDGELLRELVVLFQEDAPLRIADLKAALARRDCGSFEKAAHALKGMVSNFAAGPAFHTAGMMERQGRSCEWTGASLFLSDLESQLRQLHLSLNELVDVVSSRKIPNQVQI